MVGQSKTAERFLASIDRWFQASLLVLLMNGSLGLWAAGQVETLSAIALVAAFVLRGWSVVRAVPLRVSRRLISLLATLVVVFYPLDIYYLDGDFVSSTVRLMLLFTALKVLIAETGRDYFYLGLLAFMHLLTASMFVAGPGYLVMLAGFVVTGIFCYGSFVMRRMSHESQRIALAGGFAQRFRILGRVGSLAVVLSGGVLILSVGLFLILPRSMAEARIAPLSRGHSIGFSDGVDLGMTGSLEQDFTPVMRIESLDGTRISMQRWRGVALSIFDGVRWSPASQASVEVNLTSEGYKPGWKARRQGSEVRSMHYRVTVEPLPVRAVFVAGVPELIRGGFHALWKRPSESLLAQGASEAQSLRYDVKSWITNPDSIVPQRVVEYFSRDFIERNLSLPQDLDPRVATYTMQIVGQKISPLDRARAIEQHLKTTFAYTLDLPAEQAADPLAHFLFERREGHCEYFASAMAVMLRGLGIQARLVNGFAGGVYNPLSGLHVVRLSDAHSWVEAYIPRYGWLEFDPTPVSPDAIGGPFLSQAWMIWDAMQSAWMEWVVEFDAGRQREIARGVTQRSQSAALSALLSMDAIFQWARWAWKSLTSGPGLARPTLDPDADPLMFWTICIVLAVGFAWLIWRRMRSFARPRRDEHASVALYRRATDTLRRMGFDREVSQSPQEFVSEISDARLRLAMEGVTHSYLAARFGADERELARLERSVRSLEEDRGRPK